jgi:hypothetical protein
MPKALHAAAFALEGGQEPAAQAAAFFAAFENARAAMIESIRNAAVEHEAKLAATREALRVEAPDLSVPAPSPAPSRPRATPAAEAPTPQTMPVKKPKKSSKAAVAEAEAALDELFSEAVSASSTNSSSTTPSEEKASP